MSEAADFWGRSLKFSSLVPMLTKGASSRQITDSRNFGNEVYEKSTVASDQLSVVRASTVAPA
jgi:hypothetical protein